MLLSVVNEAFRTNRSLVARKLLSVPNIYIVHGDTKRYMFVCIWQCGALYFMIGNALVMRYMHTGPKDICIYVSTQSQFTFVCAQNFTDLLHIDLKHMIVLTRFDGRAQSSSVHVEHIYYDSNAHSCHLILHLSSLLLDPSSTSH